MVEVKFSLEMELNLIRIKYIQLLQLLIISL